MSDQASEWFTVVVAVEGVEADVVADRLWAVHSNKYDYATQRPHASEAEKKHYEETFAATAYETEHPVVRLHPETGEKSLVLGYFIQKFVGYNHVDSARLFDLFQDHVTRLENTVRWRWQAGHTTWGAAAVSGSFHCQWPASNTAPQSGQKLGSAIFSSRR